MSHSSPKPAPEVVEREGTRLLTLPLFPTLTDDDAAYIIDVIRQFNV